MKIYKLVTQRQLVREVSLERNQIKCSSDVAQTLKELYQAENFDLNIREYFVALYLNRSNYTIGYEVISIGGTSGTVADPRFILRPALDLNASSIILCHNHPSGALKPSQADTRLTKKIQKAVGYIDVQVIDHIILTEESYYSFADEGLL